MTQAAPAFTFGIEEEYHLVDLETRDLAPAPDALIKALKEKLGSRVTREFLRSQIEIGTGIASDFASAREELHHLRTTIAEEAKAFGMAPIAAGTHPFAKSLHVGTTDKERFRLLAQDLAGISRRLSICGMHVHVGCLEDDQRVDLMNQMRYFLPHLLMLSSSSPFWEGEDTGFKSYRLSIVDLMPRTGLPGRFESFAQYQQTIDVLVQAGVIEDASKVWWDIRPSPRFPTLEMRITDVCPLVDDAITIAAIYLSLMRTLSRLRQANQSWRTYPLFLLEENRWRAQRYGVDGTMFDFGKGLLVPFRDLLEELLAFIAEDAHALGCVEDVMRAREIARRGTSADRQVACLTRRLALGATRQDALAAVVDLLVAETAGRV